MQKKRKRFLSSGIDMDDQLEDLMDHTSNKILPYFEEKLDKVNLADNVK
jgi:hypothetical protein